MPEVTVAIPSFRRPRGLERLLLALEKLETSAHVSVLVADNDAEGREGLALCETLRTRGYRWPLTCIVAEERGIAQARNALVEHVLAEGRADFVAMLDDDEWPDPQWLEAFLRVQQQTGADALHGAVLRAFESAPTPAAENCHGIAPMRERTGLVPMIDSTSSVLIRRACFEGLAKALLRSQFRAHRRRRPRLLRASETARNALRLGRRGYRHSWVPVSRASFGWVLQRAYRTGNSDMRVFLKHWA